MTLSKLALRAKSLIIFVVALSGAGCMGTDSDQLGDPEAGDTPFDAEESEANVGDLAQKGIAFIPRTGSACVFFDTRPNG